MLDWFSLEKYYRADRSQASQRCGRKVCRRRPVSRGDATATRRDGAIITGEALSCAPSENATDVYQATAAALPPERGSTISLPARIRGRRMTFRQTAEKYGVMINSRLRRKHREPLQMRHVSACL
jgi:hypothetical protein